MKIFAARRNIILLSELNTIIHRGQMFIVDSEEDLPDYGYLYGEELSPELACSEDWVEFDMLVKENK